MNAPEFPSAHRHAAGVACVVQRLADLLRPIADTVNRGGSGLGDLAVAIDSLADQARTAADAIDRCLALASGAPTAARAAGWQPANTTSRRNGPPPSKPRSTRRSRSTSARVASSQTASRSPRSTCPRLGRLTACDSARRSSPGTHARSRRSPRAGSSFRPRCPRSTFDSLQAPDSNDRIAQIGRAASGRPTIPWTAGRV